MFLNFLIFVEIDGLETKNNNMWKIIYKLVRIVIKLVQKGIMKVVNYYKLFLRVL